MVIKVRDDKSREIPQVLTYLHPVSSSSLYLSALLPNYSFTPLMALLQQGYIWHQEGYWGTSLMLQLTFQTLTYQIIAPLFRSYS